MLLLLLAFAGARLEVHMAAHIIPVHEDLSNQLGFGDEELALLQHRDPEVIRDLPLVFSDFFVELGDVRIEGVDCPVFVDGAHDVEAGVGGDFEP